MKKRLLSAVSVLLAILTIVATLVVSATADNVTIDPPSLFYNDTAWERDGGYPALHFTTGAFDDFWLPLSFFENLSGVKVRRSLDVKGDLAFYVVSDEETGKYLSFQVGNEFVQTERATVFPMRTLYFHKEYHLPMRDFCTYFGWKFTYREYRHDKWVVRITDGGEKKDFDTLLAPYFEAETTDDTPVTRPPDVTEDTAPPIVTPIYAAETIVLTIEHITDETETILNLLSDYKKTAVFFVTGEEISLYPETVARILAEGHTLGLLTMTGKEHDIQSVEALLASLEEENDLLYRLFKRKTRLVRMPAGSQSVYLKLTAADYRALKGAGYVIWDWNIDGYDDRAGYDGAQVYQKIERALRIIKDPVIRLRSNEVTADALVPLFSLAEIHTSLQFRGVTEATNALTFGS